MNEVIDLKDSKVLMVDDTPANIDVLRKVLGPEGYKLSFSNTGEKALQIALRGIPDLILLDVMMPGMDGFETCRRLKQSPVTQNIPVIFITAKTDMDDLVEGFRVGAVDYITKPFRQEEVNIRVRTHLQTRALIKQRENLIQNLSASEERFRLLATWSPSGIFQADVQGYLLYANQQWRNIFEYSSEEPYQKSKWWQKIYAEDQGYVQNLWQTSVHTLKKFYGQFRIPSEQGKIRWVQIRAAASPTGEGQQVQSFVGTAEDITELKSVQEQMMWAKESAEALVREKSEFLAGMTHELRTPLNAIIGYSEMLVDEAKGIGQDVKDLEKITVAGKYLLRLINNVLDLSKVEANKMVLHLEEFQLAPLVKEVTSTISPLVAKNNNLLEVEEQQNGTMYADETKVRQILYNLLSNACKFTRDGKILLRIYRKVSDPEEWFYFEVEDTGIGLSEEDMSKLFQKYVRASSAISPCYEGTGLGLVLSRRFCHLMGGDITVKSEVGKGSIFTAFLPAKVMPSPS